MKKFLNLNTGITLIALVTTIVLLIIIAGVTVNTLTGDNGLLTKTKSSSENQRGATVEQEKNLWQTAKKTDKFTGDNNAETLSELLNRLQNQGLLTEDEIATIKDSKPVQIGNHTIDFGVNLASGDKISASIGKKASENTELKDDYGNTVWLPKDFKISSDSATAVAGGVVIEDESGNQFVWIPVGTISTTATGSNDKTITLGRYKFNSTGVSTPWSNTDTSYVEETSAEHTASGLGNAIAKDIEAFKTSATSKGGYYLARYEAGVTGYDTTVSTSNSSRLTSWTGYTNGTLVSQAGKQVWNYITQNKASELARGMYSTVNSDLVNSYAWDTAIVFIEQCGANSNYANQKGESEDDKLGTTGSKKLKTPNVIDKQCNIYDMAGNVLEWTTESFSFSDNPCVSRGGFYCGSNYYTAIRGASSITVADDFVGFRPLLYL